MSYQIVHRLPDRYISVWRLYICGTSLESSDRLQDFLAERQVEIPADTYAQLDPQICWEKYLPPGSQDKQWYVYAHWRHEESYLAEIRLTPPLPGIPWHRRAGELNKLYQLKLWVPSETNKRIIEIESADYMLCYFPAALSHLAPEKDPGFPDAEWSLYALGQGARTYDTPSKNLEPGYIAIDDECVAWMDTSGEYHERMKKEVAIEYDAAGFVREVLPL